MLSKQAFNGLLKTLEEPPQHVKFIFATTEIRKVPVTVLSRCQRFDLRRVDAAILMEHLARIAAHEKITAEPEALRQVARAAEGSVRDALSILDQAIAHGAGTVEAAAVEQMLGLADRTRVVDLFEHAMRGDAASALAEMDAQHAAGADPEVVLTDLAEFCHYVTRLKLAPNAAAGGSGFGNRADARDEVRRGAVAPRAGTRLADPDKGARGGGACGAPAHGRRNGSRPPLPCGRSPDTGRGDPVARGQWRGSACRCRSSPRIDRLSRIAACPRARRHHVLSR